MLSRFVTLVIFQFVVLMGQFPGVPIKVPVKPEICFCESWHSHKQRIKECFMNNAEQTLSRVIRLAREKGRV